MHFCDLTLAAPEQNLSCDEALLEAAERGEIYESLRVWEPNRYFVVLGYGNKASAEVNLSFCRNNNVPVLRRCTGGGTVLQGPGCINYSLILHISEHGPLHSIPSTNIFILKRHQATLTALLQAPIEIAGQTDLAIGGLKISGNAQRRKKNFLIFHGTLLLNLDISLIEKTLTFPSKHPAYRLNRSHSDFLLNLKVSSSTIKTALAKCWNALEPLPNIPEDEVNALAREKYSDPKWNFRF
jgi:lipoate---protein ligase